MEKKLQTQNMNQKKFTPKKDLLNDILSSLIYQNIIDKELGDLQPKEVEIEDATHEEKITILKYYLEQSVHSSDNEDISEDVIRAFVEKSLHIKMDLIGICVSHPINCLKH